MADLVIDDGDLAVLRDALQRAMTDVEKAHRAMAGQEASAAGAAPLVSAAGTFTGIRADELAALGREVARLVDAAGRVRTTMSEVDERLGGRARPMD